MSENIDKTINDGIKRVALLVACLASFFTPFMGTSVNIALPLLEQTLVLMLFFLTGLCMDLF